MGGEAKTHRIQSRSGIYHSKSHTNNQHILLNCQPSLIRVQCLGSSTFQLHSWCYYFPVLVRFWPGDEWYYLVIISLMFFFFDWSRLHHVTKISFTRGCLPRTSLHTPEGSSKSQWNWHRDIREIVEMLPCCPYRYRYIKIERHIRSMQYDDVNNSKSQCGESALQNYFCTMEFS